MKMALTSRILAGAQRYGLPPKAILAICRAQIVVRKIASRLLIGREATSATLVPIKQNEEGIEL